MTPKDAGRNLESRPDDTHTMSLASATRDYARAVDEHRFERATACNLASWAAAMKPWIWAWQRARRLAEQAPWRASPEVEERHERTRAAAWMLKDIAAWEKALAALDAQIDRARRYDKPVPPPLDVPTPVATAIRAKRAAALERATARRGGRAGGGGSTPALTPDEGVPRPPFPSKPR